jgi:hypothetical protein
MNLNYYKETDSLYIDLSSIESKHLPLTNLIA